MRTRCGRTRALASRRSRGITAIRVASDYADRLADVGGRLYLSGLQPSLTERLHRTGTIDGPMRAFEATPIVGESTHEAYLDAESWLVKRRGRVTTCRMGDRARAPGKKRQSVRS